MIKIKDSQASSSDLGPWHVPELISGVGRSGRRIINQQAKRALIVRLRASRSSIPEASQANNIRKGLLQSWLGDQSASRRKRKQVALKGTASQSVELIPVQVIQSRKVVQPGVFECELELPKGTLRIKCNAESIGALIGQLQ